MNAYRNELLMKNKSLFSGMHRVWLWGAALVMLLFTGACQEAAPVVTEAPPTVVPLAALPDEPVESPGMMTATAVPRSAGSGGRSGSSFTPTPPPPTPAGQGVRPQEARQLFVPDAGLAAPVEWRPPPYEVPLAIHYDDHYWLARPISAAHRNYALDWYPFGNDVQLPDIPSYRIHHGLDFPNETGTPVLAAADGTVVHAGPLPSPRNGVNYYGNTVIILHDWQYQGEAVYTLYAHTLELFVTVGARVQQGQLIAGVGSSGEVSGPHLHFEVRLGENNYNDAHNPSLWIVPFEGWGTLAGRFVDRRGRFIPNATLTLSPIAVETETNVRIQQTYAANIRSDPVWRENFVFGDVPAGTYELLIDMNDGVHIYRREVTVNPGQTSFEVISTTFDFIPTPTPPPTATPLPTPESATPESATPEGEEGAP